MKFLLFGVTWSKWVRTHLKWLKHSLIHTKSFRRTSDFECHVCVVYVGYCYWPVVCYTLQGSIAKKPYNPIIGETFYCSWRVPSKQCTRDSRSQGAETPNSAPQPSCVQNNSGSGSSESANGEATDSNATEIPESDQRTRDSSRSRDRSSVQPETEGSSSNVPLRLWYCAEQVSHHPPGKIQRLTPRNIMEKVESQS